jgi:hypothetical protein
MNFLLGVICFPENVLKQLCTSQAECLQWGNCTSTADLSILNNRLFKPDRYLTKQGDALSPLVFNFALEYAQGSQEGLEWNKMEHISTWSMLTMYTYTRARAIYTIKKDNESSVS